VISGVYWDKGGRSLNQDSLTFQQAMTARGRVALAAVSDGIGGLAEGENASGYITEKLTENFYAQMLSLVGRGKGAKAIKRSLLRCLCEISDDLRHYGKGRDLRLGATISLLFVWRRRYVLFHLGDSRVYFYRKGKMALLTSDHSDGGRALAKCLGSFPFQYPDIRFGRIYGRCGFLLCTDGFYRTLTEDAFLALAPEDVGSESQIERRLREMAVLAGKNGGQDNLSAVYTIFG